MPDRGPLIYLPPSLRHFEPAFLTFSTWMDHLPFGYDIVEAVRPRLLVELGSHKGFSYFTFCQSMKDHDIDGLCYAVDTWEGDRHTDSYGEEVFQEVNRYNRQHYAGFSYLLRMLFEEALGHFRDASVDLIHIDGLHTYEAVRRDFEDWYPKLRPGGIMLFHDIAARMALLGRAGGGAPDLPLRSRLRPRGPAQARRRGAGAPPAAPAVLRRRGHGTGPAPVLRPRRRIPRPAPQGPCPGERGLNVSRATACHVAYTV